MKHSTEELWLAFIAIVIITLLYLFVAFSMQEVPGASGLFGHSLGILGFVLMLMTEILYTQRKRSRSARWGRMSSWLKFHIFTGIVGPYMVLLHSSWKFNGLAGLVILFTIIVVLSGFVGRYIYTAVPRNADGAVLESHELEQEILRTQFGLQQWVAANPKSKNVLLPVLMNTGGGSTSSLALIFGRGLQEWGNRLQWWRIKQGLGGASRRQVAQLEKMFKRRRTLERQIASLAMARQMLSLWHAVHIPIGLALFFAAFVHIAGAIYYATLLR